MPPLSDIAGRVPIWVLPLFVLLVFVGLRATRDRTAPLVLIYALPLLGLLSVGTLSALQSAVVWPTFGTAMAVGTWLGWRWQRAWLIRKAGNKAELRGEWITFASIMTVFLCNFALRTVLSVAPGALQGAGVLMVVPILPGLVSGSFLGRALYLLRAPQG